MSLKNALLALSLIVVGYAGTVEAGCRRVCKPCPQTCQARPVCGSYTAQAYDWKVTGRTYDARTGVTWTHYTGYPVSGGSSYAGYDNNSNGYTPANTAQNSAQQAPSYDRRGSQTDILQSAPRRNGSDADSDLDFYAFPRR